MSVCWSSTPHPVPIVHRPPNPPHVGGGKASPRPAPRPLGSGSAFALSCRPMARDTVAPLDLRGVFSVPPLPRRNGPGRPLDLDEAERVVRHIAPPAATPLPFRAPPPLSPP